MRWTDSIEKLDVDLFLQLNGANNSFFDWLMPILTSKYTWLPFYLILILIYGYKYKWKALWLFIPGIALTIGMTNETSDILKASVGRLRPCWNEELSAMVHLVKDGCGGQFSFVSAHAANSFAIATFFGITYRNKTALILLLVWAGIVAYSRIYIGVHYPLDIICGALIGVVFAYAIAMLVLKLQRRYFLQPK